MDTGKYQVFLQVAQTGNLTRAAQALGYTQSAVSRIIADLEAEWQLTLFSRSRTGVTLTQAGRELLPQIRAICSAGQELEQQVGQLHGLTCGTVRIGTFPSAAAHWLPSMMKTFLAKYPNIRFDVRSHIEYRQVEDWIATGELDCGFLALPPVRPLESRFLRRDPFVAVLPLDHPLAQAPSFPMVRFGQEPFVKLEDARDRELAVLFESQQVTPNVRYTVSEDYAIMSMVESGLGVSVLTNLVVRRTPYRIATLPLDPPQHRDILLAVRSFSALSPAAARFVEHVGQWLEEHPDREP